MEIAHEVQAQLFPPAISGTGTLELYGLCQPARTVSGDYYDFLSYGPEQMGIAVGDISGKGISAALLMATIHSAVRAYEQEQLFAVGAGSAKAFAAGGQGRNSYPFYPSRLAVAGAHALAVESPSLSQYPAGKIRHSLSRLL